jgi:hypothetical protein
MATTLDIVTRAFRKAGITAHDDELTADQAAVGIAALNDMMHGWTLRVRTWAHSDLALGDVFPMPAPFHEGVVYMLAATIAPDFSVGSFSSEEWFRRFATHYRVIPSAKSDVNDLRYSVQRYRVL